MEHKHTAAREVVKQASPITKPQNERSQQAEKVSFTVWITIYEPLFRLYRSRERSRAICLPLIDFIASRGVYGNATFLDNSS